MRRHLTCSSRYRAALAASDRVVNLVNQILHRDPESARRALDGARTVQEALERSGVFGNASMTAEFATETRGVLDRLTDEQNRRILDAVRDGLEAHEAVSVRWEGLFMDAIDVEVSRGVYITLKGSSASG